MPSILNAKQKMLLQRAQELDSVIRAGKSGVELLDDAENNVGNATKFEPQALPPGQLFTTVPQSLTNNARILNLTATSRRGQSITVVMTSAKTEGNKGLTGPFTGIIEFGNGTQTTRVEFDVPFGPFTSPSLVGDAENDQPQDSGAVVQVPAGALRVFGRYDNAFVTPEIQGYAFGGPGSPGVLAAISGPFAPNLGPPTTASPPSPLQSKAFAAYFGRIHTKLYKTQYIYVGSPLAPVTMFYVPAPGAQLPAFYSVPPFAKSVRLVRQPQTAAMEISLIDSSSAFLPSETYAVPSGVAPVIPIEGNETIISVKSASGGNPDKVYFAKLVYELAF